MAQSLWKPAQSLAEMLNVSSKSSSSFPLVSGTNLGAQSQKSGFKEGTVYAQVDEDQAYDTPSAIPHEGSKRCEGFDVARPGEADDEVEEPEDRGDESHS